MKGCVGSRKSSSVTARLPTARKAPLVSTSPVPSTRWIVKFANHSTALTPPSPLGPWRLVMLRLGQWFADRFVGPSIHERLDLKLLAAVARLRPDLQLILVGPVLKLIRPAYRK